MKTSKKIFYITIIAIIGFTSCSKNLDVEYLNKPNTEKVLSLPVSVVTSGKVAVVNLHRTSIIIMKLMPI